MFALHTQGFNHLHALGGVRNSPSRSLYCFRVPRCLPARPPSMQCCMMLGCHQERDTGKAIFHCIIWDQTNPAPPCPSNAYVQAAIGTGSINFWSFTVAWTRGGGGGKLVLTTCQTCYLDLVELDSSETCFRGVIWCTKTNGTPVQDIPFLQRCLCIILVWAHHLIAMPFESISIYDHCPPPP